MFEAVDNVFIDALFEAVTEGNPDLAREAMRGHLLQTERDADQYLTPRDQAAAVDAMPLPS